MRSGRAVLARALASAHAAAAAAPSAAPLAQLIAHTPLSWPSWRQQRAFASWRGGGSDRDRDDDGDGNDGNGIDGDGALFAAAATSLADHAAREALRDPLGALMAGTGLPLGIRVPPRPPTPASSAAGGAAAMFAAADAFLSSASSSSSSCWPSSPARHCQGSWGAAAEVIDVVERVSGSADEEEEGGRGEDEGADRQRQQRAGGGGGGAAAAADALDRLLSTHQGAAPAGGTTWARGYSSSGGSSSGSSSSTSGDVGAGGDGGKGGGGEGGEGEGGGGGSGGDSWGTTSQSAAEIARRIADSNAAAAAAEGAGTRDDPDLDDLLGDPAFAEALGGAGGGGGAGGAGGGDPVEALKADLRAMDEVFEVVAQVPWMDGAELDDAELRGVVAVGLLGTLEEVGFAALRSRVRRVWQGERDVAALSAGAEPREAAALLSVLYHTRRLEDRHGPASAAGRAAAVRAADAADADVAQAADLAAALKGGERRGGGGGGGGLGGGGPGGGGGRRGKNR